MGRFGLRQFISPAFTCPRTCYLALANLWPQAVSFQRCSYTRMSFRAHPDSQLDAGRSPSLPRAGVMKVPFKTSSSTKTQKFSARASQGRLCVCLVFVRTSSDKSSRRELSTRRKRWRLAPRWSAAFPRRRLARRISACQCSGL